MFFWMMILSAVVFTLYLFGFLAFYDANRDAEISGGAVFVLILLGFFTITMVSSYIMYKINGNIWNNINDVILVILGIMGVMRNM